LGFVDRRNARFIPPGIEIQAPRVARVVAALEGQYVLFVEKPALNPGSHRLNIRLKDRDGVVLAPGTYVNDDRAEKRHP